MASASPDSTATNGTCVVGCGVIGSGWVARLALRGRAVRWVDPAPDADERLAAVLDRAERAWGRLELPVAAEPRIERCDTIDDAVAEAGVIVECLPERLDLKRAAYAEIEAAAPSDALIMSSTSGLKPSDLQAELAHPERLVVGHPFNPVYLLPLIEVVGGAKTSEATIDAAEALCRDLRMKPLRVRVEIDAFIADRLLEAVWREALWLVNDGVATTAEIDDAIRYGFGLRWAQMGLFETYRIAGGEGGMAHFISQFGETLSWPWTKLMDTPELTEELIETIGRQSDDQSGARSIAELEQARDDNLVAILDALATNDWGAGQLIAEARQERRAG